MRTFKRLFYSSIIGIFCALVAINVFSEFIIDDLKQYSSLHVNRNTLHDSAIICTQLYLMDPSDINKLTCDKINNKIKFLNNKLNNYYFTNLYLNTIK